MNEEHKVTCSHLSSKKIKSQKYGKIKVTKTQDSMKLCHRKIRACNWETNEQKTSRTFIKTRTSF